MSKPKADKTPPSPSPTTTPLVFKYQPLWQRILKEIRELCIIAAFVLVIITHVVQGSVVIGGSMKPTFNNGNLFPPDLVIVNKISWYFQNWQYGDVVILYSPREPQKKLIKRLVGKEFDVLKIENIEYTVGVGEVFVVGDNLHDSYDSRSFGPVPATLLQGKVWLQIWPFFPKVVASTIDPEKIQIQKHYRHLTEPEILVKIQEMLAKKKKVSPDLILPQNSLKELQIPSFSILAQEIGELFPQKNFFDDELKRQETPQGLAHYLYTEYIEKELRSK